MTHVITSACIGSMDRSCIEVCPVDCIYEVDRMLVVHPDECIDCGACIPGCPVDAIHAETDVPAGERSFVAVNAAITHGAAAVNAALDALRAVPPTTDPILKGADAWQQPSSKNGS
jgi:NAD-dependent dihydropyrimidine dehydrogenase PreA subunit